MCVRVPMIVSTILQSLRWWIFCVGIPHTTWRIHVLGSSSRQSILSGCEIEWRACVVAYSCDKLLTSRAILAGVSIPPIPWLVTDTWTLLCEEYHRSLRVLSVQPGSCNQSVPFLCGRCYNRLAVAYVLQFSSSQLWMEYRRACLVQILPLSSVW